MILTAAVNKGICRNSVAIFLSICLGLFNTLSYAAVPVAKIESTPITISIPDDLGKIDETFQGSSGKTIIYIQDAHDSLEAQENIAKIIDYAVQHYGVKTIFEEGYEGLVPTDDYFSFMKDPIVKGKVSYFLLDKLRIGGAEYAHINREKDFKLIGADSINLHLKNIRWYRENSKHQKETKKDLAVLEKEIDRLVNQYFPRELKDLVKLKKRLDEKQIPLLDYLKRIRSLRGEISNDNETISYPNIAALLSAEDSKDEIIIKKVRLIDSKNLFEEINLLEDEIASRFLSEKRDRKIFHYHKSLELLKRLNAIELTPPEYEAVRETLKNLDTQELAKFIVNQRKKSTILSKRWEENIQNAIRFYEVSKERDSFLEGNLKDFIRGREKIAVLVFGGFHKEKIQEILKQKNLSYLIVSPKITDIDTKHRDYYKRLMSIGYLPFEIPFYVRQAARAESRFLQVKEGGLRIDMAFRSELRILSESLQTNPGLDRPDFLFQIERVLSTTTRSEMRTNPIEELSIEERKIIIATHKIEAKFPREQVEVILKDPEFSELPSALNLLLYLEESEKKAIGFIEARREAFEYLHQYYPELKFDDLVEGIEKKSLPLRQVALKQAWSDVLNQLLEHSQKISTYSEGQLRVLITSISRYLQIVRRAALSFSDEESPIYIKKVNLAKAVLDLLYSIYRGKRDQAEQIFKIYLELAGQTEDLDFGNLKNIAEKEADDYGLKKAPAIEKPKLPVPGETQYEVFRAERGTLVGKAQFREAPKLSIAVPAILIEEKQGSFEVRRNPNFFNPLLEGLNSESSPLAEIARAIKDVLSEATGELRQAVSTVEGRERIQSFLDNNAVSYLVFMMQHVVYERVREGLRETIRSYLNDRLEIDRSGVKPEQVRKYAQFAIDQIKRERPQNKIALIHSAINLQIVVEGEAGSDNPNVLVLEKNVYQFEQGRRDAEGRLPAEKVVFGRWQGRRLMFYVSRSHTIRGALVRTWRQAEGFTSGWIIKADSSRYPENVDDLPPELSIQLDEILPRLALVPRQKALVDQIEELGFLLFRFSKELEQVFAVQNLSELNNIRRRLSEEALRNRQIQEALEWKKRELRPLNNEEMSNGPFWIRISWKWPGLIAAAVSVGFGIYFIGKNISQKASQNQQIEQSIQEESFNLGKSIHRHSGNIKYRSWGNGLILEESRGSLIVRIPKTDLTKKRYLTIRFQTEGESKLWVELKNKNEKSLIGKVSISLRHTRYTRTTEDTRILDLSQFLIEGVSDKAATTIILSDPEGWRIEISEISFRSEVRAGKIRPVPEEVARSYRERGYFNTLRRLGIGSKTYFNAIHKYLLHNPEDQLDYFALTYTESKHWIKHREEEQKLHGVLNSSITATYLVLVTLDTIPDFKKARERNQIKKMAELYRQYVIAYEPTDKQKYEKKGQHTFFYEVGGLGGLMNNPRPFLAKRDSPASLLRLTLPQLIDLRNPDALNPLEVDQGYWNDPENAKYHILLALDTIPDFQEAREQNNIKKMAELYREYVIPYEPKDIEKYERKGQKTFFEEVGGLRGLMNYPRPFLDKMSSPTSLLHLALPGLIDDGNPDALKTSEVEKPVRGSSLVDEDLITAYKELYQELGRKPTQVALAQRLNVSQHTISRRLTELARKEISLETKRQRSEVRGSRIRPAILKTLNQIKQDLSARLEEQGNHDDAADLVKIDVKNKEFYREWFQINYIQLRSSGYEFVKEKDDPAIVRVSDKEPKGGAIEAKTSSDGHWHLRGPRGWIADVEFLENSGAIVRQRVTISNVFAQKQLIRSIDRWFKKYPYAGYYKVPADFKYWIKRVDQIIFYFYEYPSQKSLEELAVTIHPYLRGQTRPIQGLEQLYEGVFIGKDPRQPELEELVSSAKKLDSKFGLAKKGLGPITEAVREYFHWPEMSASIAQVEAVKNVFTRLEDIRSGQRRPRRSEVRKYEALYRTFTNTIHLQSDVVFTIRPETLEKLARAKKVGEHDQWLELLGLKMLNEEKLHIVIDSREEQALSGRTAELLMSHKKVYLGWGPRTLATLPKNAPVIQFEKLLNGEISGDVLKEQTARRINATFDVFDGAFLAALRYAQNPIRLDELARQKMKVITSATAMDLGLLDQLFKTYAIVSQAA